MKSHKYIFIAAMMMFTTSVQAQLEIFTCEPEWAALATELGGNHVNVFSATTGKQDPHHIEARPSLIAKIRRADLIVCTGAELETGWLPVLLSKSGNEKIQLGKSGHFMAADYVELLEKPVVLDRSQGDMHARGNPHIHTNPHNIAKVAKALNQRMNELNATNRASYNTAYENFIQRWNTAIMRWEKQAAPIRQQSIAVSHNSWVYLASWLDVDMSVALEPKPGIPPASEHLAKLVTTVNQKNIRKIVYASYTNPRAAHWLAEKTGATVIELPFTVGGNAKANNLFELFDETIRALVN